MTLLILTASQVLLGTQVREHIDHIMNTTPELPREYWLFRAGAIHDIHRSFSWLLLIAAAGALFLGRKFGAPVRFVRLYGANLLLIGVQMLIGATLSYGHLPQAAQVLHLGTAMVMVSVQTYFMLVAYTAQTATR